MDADVREMFGVVLEAIRALDGRFSARFDQIDTRFAEIDGRLDKIDGRLDKSDARLDRMDARFDRMDARFDRMDARLDQMDRRFEQAEASLEAFRRETAANFKAVDEHFAKTDARIEEVWRQGGAVAEDLRKRIAAAPEGMDALTRRVESLEVKVDEGFAEMRAMIPISFVQIEQQVRSLQGDVTDLQTRVDRLESSAQ